MAVSQGTATATQNGNRLDVTASRNAVLDWQKFNIAPGEITTFHQPSAISVVWNRVADPNPSHLLGTLNANGIVVLMNQNGFYFGPNSVVNVGGLVVSTVSATPPAAAGGGVWQFQGPPPAASIVNHGEIKARAGGSLFLISEHIENHGTLSAPQGQIGLYAGREVLLTDRPDGRGLSAAVRLPEGSVDNSGKLIADAGTVALHAKVVNQNGLVQANTVRKQNGIIELVASDAVHLGPNSLIRASAEAGQKSPGGQVTINTFNDGAREVQTTSDVNELYKGVIERALRARWNRPDDVRDENYTADIELTLDKSGAITRWQCVKGSGDKRWDDSVKQALAQTKSINRPPPKGFPEKFLVRFDVAAEASGSPLQLSSR